MKILVLFKDFSGIGKLRLVKQLNYYRSLAIKTYVKNPFTHKGLEVLFHDGFCLENCISIKSEIKEITIISISRKYSHGAIQSKIDLTKADSFLKEIENKERK